MKPINSTRPIEERCTSTKGLAPSLWTSLIPLGLGHQKPNNYYELWRALLENRDQLGYAWHILNEGVCDGCAIGTTGLKDWNWTLPGPHLQQSPTAPAPQYHAALNIEQLENVEKLSNQVPNCVNWTVSLTR